MARHLARRGGIWWTRLVVPERLRQAVGRREFIQSCRTADLHMAKTVAALLIAEWRQSLMRVELAGMDSQALKLLKPAPALALGGTMTLAETEALGVDCLQVLRIVAEGKLKLYCRIAAAPGHLLNPKSLDADPITGGWEVPMPRYMPSDAIPAIQTGVFAVPDSCQLAGALLVEGVNAIAEVVSVEVPDGRWFVPEHVLKTPVKALEINAEAVRRLRGYLVSKLPEAEIDRELAIQNVSGGKASRAEDFGPRAGKLFSEALEAYCADPDGLPSRLASTIEIRQRKNSMLLFAEFMGDMPLGQITSDVLRRYRDGPLRQIPAKANNLPKGLKRVTMVATIAAIKDAGAEWPLLSLEMRQERMRHLFRLFAWLQTKEWINFNPAAALAGETGLTKAQRSDEKRRIQASKDSDDDEIGRPPFSAAEVRLIFSQPQYTTGDGRHISKGNVAWYPFEYWLPLLGLYGGCRISEVSQLHLADVRMVRGVWVLDLIANTLDKRLKNDNASKRQIPIHPKLIELGFLEYCDALRTEGFRRVFPELSYSRTDARYAKEPIRKMSAMLKRLGMPRNNNKVFHCLRHNINDVLARVPMSVLPFADENLRKYIRYKIMGHQQADDVNVQHYTSSPISEAASLMKGVTYDLPQIQPFNIKAGMSAVKKALAKKKAHRCGKEDMGPAADTGDAT